MTTETATTTTIATNKASHIAALDVGTTYVRCFVLDDKCVVKGSAADTVELLNPQPGYFEIEPEGLWRKIVKVITESIRDAKLTPANITCLTISTQRCTFLTWNHRTKEYYHNFITWKDLRADDLVQQWNASCSLRGMNGVAYALYLLTRNSRFLAGSMLKLMNSQVTPRLLHEMAYNPKLQQALQRKEARFELLDSWILYKLRSGNGLDVNVEHITDITSATATGLYDPFTLNWSAIGRLLFGIDLNIMPRVVENSYQNFGHVHPAAFGPDWGDTKIPIAASLSDQTAAIWGSQCFSTGDVKVTMGTGAFLNLITGVECKAVISGMYPLVAWQLKQGSKLQQRDTIYCIEGAAHDFGTVVSWAQSCELFDDPAETSDIATSVPDTNDVYFMPAFSGLGPPVNDYRAASGFIGMTPSTTKAHMVRALLESIVFRVVQLIESAEEETQQKLKVIRVDGGVSRNDFVCQFLADASGLSVERAECSESSIMGATYLAGVNHGIWQTLEELKSFRKVERIFKPQAKNYKVISNRMLKWNKAIERFSGWY
ncbi:putative glycerol kinase 5 [Drosophila sulfurigaster albostrigata]|uniref:putative glycerol kinase 5 n=1 Tax=Drosophila sulfurigaster albostrigata TaxID=89887 RepID=UPI002D21C2F5|nr:putative glycerol kinase 5 [Drosophila sulfurigaster albostrigata]